MPKMRGSCLCGARVSAPPTEPGGVERCCPWTRTTQGFIGLVGRPNGGQRYLGEVGSALHKAVFSSRKEALVVRKEASCCW